MGEQSKNFEGPPSLTMNFVGFCNNWKSWHNSNDKSHCFNFHE